MNSKPVRMNKCFLKWCVECSAFAVCCPQKDLPVHLTTKIYPSRTMPNRLDKRVIGNKHSPTHAFIYARQRIHILSQKNHLFGINIQNFSWLCFVFCKCKCTYVCRLLVVSRVQVVLNICHVFCAVDLLAERRQSFDLCCR